MSTIRNRHEPVSLDGSHRGTSVRHAKTKAGAGRYTPKPSAALTLEESVAHRAEVLLTIGAEVLNGNFAILVERQRRRQGAPRAIAR